MKTRITGGLSWLVLIFGILLPNAPLLAQTDVTTNSGDETVGSLGWAVTTLNNAGAGAISIENSVSPITLTQPLSPVSQSVTFQGTGNEIVGQNDTQSLFLFQQAFTLDNGASLTFTNNGTLSSGLDAGVTAASWNLFSNSAFSLTGGNGQTGITGGGALITLGTAVAGPGSGFLIQGGAGGGNPSGTAGDGGSAAISITTLSLSGSNGTMAGGAGGNGSFQSGAGGGATLSLDSLSLDTLAQLNLTGGNGGTSTGGAKNGGNAVLAANSVSLAGSAILNISAGSGGSDQAANSGPINAGNGGSALVSTASLSVDSQSLLTMTAGGGGGAFTGGGGQSGNGGSVTVSVGGNLSLTNQGSLGITAGAGGSTNSGGTGGNVFLNAGSVTQGAGSTLSILSGAGGGSASGGTVEFLPGNQNLATGATFIAAGGAGGSGNTIGGNGGSVQVGVGVVTIASGSTWEALGGAAGTGISSNGSGGNVSVNINDLEGSGFVSLGGTGQTSLQLVHGDFSGILQGAEGLNVTGFGVVTLTGNNTYSGGTTLTSATLIINSDANVGTGSLTFDGGTLRLGGAFTSSKSVSLTANGGTFNVNAFNLIENGILLGQGGLGVNGNGTLTLEGVNTYAGPTTVSSGALLLVGDLSHPGAQIAGPVTLDTAGTLMGFGSILGAVSNNGTLQAGEAGSIGSLNAGSYSQTPGGTLNAEVSPSQGSLLRVNSGAALDGTLTVNQDPGSYGVRYSYVLLSAGSVTGSFAVTSFNSLQYFNPSLSYGPAAVTFTLTRTNADFTTWAAGTNQTALGTALNGLVTTGSDALAGKLNELYLLPSGQGTVLGHLTGDIYTALPGIMLDNTQFEESLLFDRLEGEPSVAMSGAQAGLVRQALAAEVSGNAGNAAGLANPGVRGLWVENTDSTGSVNADPNVSGFNKSNFGFLAGYDSELAKGLTGGLMGGYVHTDITASDSTAKTGVDSVQFGVYGSKAFGKLEVGLVAGYGINHFQSSRSISIGTDANQIAGAFDGSQYQAALQVGYPLNLSGLMVKPLAGVQYGHFSENAVTESGSSPLALAIPEQSYDSLRPYLGLDAAKPLNLDVDLRLLPRVNLSVSQEMTANPVQFAAAFAGESQNPFTVTGISPSATTVDLGGSLDLLFGKQFNLFAGYQGNFSGTQTMSTFNGGINLVF